MNKLIFLDRDGTVIKDYEDNQWGQITEIEIINRKLLTFLIENQFEIVFISNQYLIEEGYITNEQFTKIDKQFKDYLLGSGLEKVNIKYAFSKRSENNYYTKPNAGMIMEYLYENKISDINNCMLIGDSDVDYQLACNLNLKFANIKNVSCGSIIEKIRYYYHLD